MKLNYKSFVKYVLLLKKTDTKGWVSLCMRELKKWLSEKRFRLMDTYRSKKWTNKPNWDTEILETLNNYYLSQKDDLPPKDNQGKFIFGAEFVQWVTSNLKEQGKKIGTKKKSK